MKSYLIKIIPWLIVGLVGYFFVHTILDNIQSLKDTQLQLNNEVVIGTSLFVLAVVISGILWGKLINFLSPEVNISMKDAVRIHSASWLLKYVPGQVGSIANKLTWGKKKGISQKSITNSFIYENVLLVLASAILSAPVMVLFQGELGKEVSLFAPLLIIIPIAFVIYKPIFYRLLNFIFKRIGKKPFRDSDFLSTPQLLKFLVLYSLPRLVTGVAFVCIAVSFLAVEPSMYVGLVSLYILATVVGLLAIFVPGGIGVREAVIVLLASVYFPVEQAVVLSLVARFYATIADIGVGGIYLILNKGKINYYD